MDQQPREFVKNSKDKHYKQPFFAFRARFARRNCLFADTQIQKYLLINLFFFARETSKLARDLLGCASHVGPARSCLLSSFICLSILLSSEL